MAYRRGWRAFAFLAALSLVAVACGGDDDGGGVTTIATTAATRAEADIAPASDGEAVASTTTGSGAFGLDPVDPLAVSGDIAVAGLNHPGFSGGSYP